jgi:cytochrome c biogenesis protein CcmG/thiol:disulfide interchange protein DsbE
MAWRRLALTALVIVPLIALLAYAFKRDPHYITTPLIGRPAPQFSLTLFDGKTLRLEDLRGKPVFVTFWASWCPPCRAEAADLEAAWRKAQNKDVVFLGVNIQDQEDQARAFIKEFDVTFPNGRDESGKLALEYGVWGIPEAFFISPDGKITYKHVGSVGTAILLAKLDEAGRGIVSAREGKGSYQSIR